MSLEKLSSQINASSDGKKQTLPPVELWNPPYCGEIDLIIKANGDWFYNGTIFKRQSLVKLLASVLICEKNDNQGDEYFLVTPVEKIKITVEDAPFVLTQWHWLDEKKQTMQVATNLGDEFILDAEHGLSIDETGALYVTVRRNLTARVHRNVYYQWVDLASQVKTKQGTELVFLSEGCQFSLGVID
ncbi:DUF1285 domain-containing protein [Colwelliaceae bacterium 6441]